MCSGIFLLYFEQKKRVQRLPSFLLLLFLLQVVRLSPQPDPSLSRAAAVAPRRRPLDTTTVSLNDLSPLIPPSRTLPNLPSLPPIMKMRINSCLQHHLPSEGCWCCCCQILWRQRVIVFVRLHPSSVHCPCVVQLFVRRASCSRTLGRTGKRQSEVNQRRLPIWTLVGRRSVFSCSLTGMWIYSCLRKAVPTISLSGKTCTSWY